MNKYIDKEKLVKYLKFNKQLYQELMKNENTNIYYEEVLREYKLKMLIFNDLLQEIEKFNIGPPKFLENSVTAEAIKADYIEDSAKWLDDEFADKKDEWINEKTESILLENDGEFISEIIEEIIKE